MSGPAQVLASIATAMVVFVCGLFFAINKSIEGLLGTGLVAVALLHLSSYVLWANERNDATDLEEKLQDKTNAKEAIAAICVVMMEGRDLMSSCDNGPVEPTDQECDDWKNKTETVIRRHLGAAHFARFQVARDPPIDRFHGDDYRNRKWNGLRYRVVNLLQFIEELSPQ